jgi:D,D-heptose 1,7-bisphosphate phosphatase
MKRLGVKAVFMDRDGIISELVYYPELGVVDSPFTIEQFKLTPSAVQAVNCFHELGYRVIVISNQPGIAKGHFDEATFDLIRLRMHDLLRRANVQLDGEYYCFHHPDAVREEYRKVCDCRKPRAGLILRAARDHNITLAKSFFIGDGLGDVKAGREAGCITVLVASQNGFLLRLNVTENPNYDFA